MSLQIIDINFSNFRNYKDFSLTLPKNPLIIVGNNAVGKTNIIEGIQLLSMLSSFKSPQWVDVVYKGETTARISIHFLQDGRDLTIEMCIEEGRRSYYLNGKKKKVIDLIGLIPAILFIPDDLFLVKGPPTLRRNLLDTLGSQLSQTYATIVQDFEKIIKQKNQLLKENKDTGIDVLILESWNHNLAQVGALLSTHRIRLYSKLITKAQKIYASISLDEELSAHYIPTFFEYNGTFLQEELLTLTREEFQKQLELALIAAQEEELRRAKSIIGPQRDGINFFINQNNARDYGSQGQQRTIALALKLAELELLREIHGSEPILLLDDVMSELDEKRRNTLLAAINKETPIFITTTNLGYFNASSIENAQILRLPLQG